VKIVATFKPSDEIIIKTKTLYPEETFIFQESINNAFDDIKDADVLLTFGEDLTAEIIDEAINLKWIMVVSAGLELMPLQAIKERDIIVTNARGIHKIPMAEYTIFMMLQVVRQGKRIYEIQQQRKWERDFSHAMELYGKTLVIVGIGAIGSEIAKLAKAFSMKVIGVNKSGTPNEHVDEIYPINHLEHALSQGDFIVSILPSTEKTKHLFMDRHFDVMKRNAVFMNIGRGDVVKDATLIQAIQDKKMAHAVVDVFEQEPLPANHPFWEMENVTVTPHISSRTNLYLPRAFEIFYHNLQVYKYASGEYSNLVDLNRGY